MLWITVYTHPICLRPPYFHIYINIGENDTDVSIFADASETVAKVHQHATFTELLCA